MTLRPEEEGRHAPDPGSVGWEESWDLSFHSAAGDFGGYVRLGLLAQSKVAWLWVAVVGNGRPLVQVVDDELGLPRPPGLDLRAEGLWTSLTCETPVEHWSVGLEAFGVALDDPTEAWRSGRGDRIAVGLDLEWETTIPLVDVPSASALPDDAASGGKYHLACLVHGEVLLGREVISFDGWGGRSHAWGVGRWGGEDWCTTAGLLDDGTTWCGEAGQGTVQPGVDGLTGPGRLVLPGGAGTVSIDPRHHAPVGVTGPDGKRGRLVRSLCHHVAPDGRRGAGWTEWYQGPAASSP